MPSLSRREMRAQPLRLGEAERLLQLCSVTVCRIIL